MSPRPFERRIKPRDARLFVGIAAATLVATGAVHAFLSDPERAYKTAFTQDGACLDKTAYDPDKGANVQVTKRHDTEIVRVTPVQAEGSQPTVLVLQVESNGPFSRPTLTMADHYAGSILVQHGCIGENSGQ